MLELDVRLDVLRRPTARAHLYVAGEGISENPNDELWSIWSAKISAAPANSSVDSLLAQTCTP